MELGVAAVNDDVAGLQQRGDGLDRLFGRAAGRHHDPHDAGGGKLRYHRCEGRCPGAAASFGLLDQIRRPIVHHDAVSVALQARDHVHPHFA